MKSLFLVKCRGMQLALGGSSGHGIAYVIADDAGEAYRIVKEDLEKRGLGYDHDRALESVTLLAEESDYTQITKLYAASATQRREG